MNKPSKNGIAKLVTAFLLGLLSLHIQAADFVEISAEIESLAYGLHDTNSAALAKPKTFSLVCITGGEEWDITITNDYLVKQREQWFFAGTNVVCRTHPPSDSERTRLLKAGGTFAPITEPHEQVWGSRDGHPMAYFNVNIPWLAFCSGSYLKRDGRMIPLPIAILRHCPDRFAYTDLTTTFDDGLGLPRTLDLFSSQALFLKSHTDWDKEHNFRDRYTEWNKKTAPKIQDGVLVFHYAVLESTNVLGRSFPTKFEFFQTGRPYEQMGDWYCQGIGRVKSIRPSTKPPSLK